MKKLLLLFLLCILPLQATNNTTIVKSGFKKGVSSALDAVEGVPLIGGIVKGVRKWIPGTEGKDEAMVSLLDEQVQSSKTTLEKMQELSRSMLKMKAQVEESAAIKKQGE